MLARGGTLLPSIYADVRAMLMTASHSEGRDNAKFLNDVAFGKVDLGAHIDRASSGEPPEANGIRMQGLAGLNDVQYTAPELEQTRSALLRIKASLVGCTSTQWQAALQSQEVTESQWLSDLRQVLEQLVGLASERMAQFDPEHPAVYGEGHEHDHHNEDELQLH